MAGSVAQGQAGVRITDGAELLAEYAAPPLDQSIDDALRDFVARRKTAAPDGWYWAPCRGVIMSQARVPVRS